MKTIERKRKKMNCFLNIYENYRKKKKKNELFLKHI